MVAINSFYAPPQKEALPLLAGGHPPTGLPDLIWTLHRIIVDPAADPSRVKNAKAVLLRAVTASGESLRITVPPLPTSSKAAKRPGLRSRWAGVRQSYSLDSVEDFSAATPAN
jgi:hypothetical protein